jgi:glutathione peroxidase
MIKIIALLAGMLYADIYSYDYSFQDIDGQIIDLSQFQGKKVLFVNTASNSPYTAQYAGLEQLYQQYKDSLVIIAFPSNDFGNESGNDAAIKSFVKQNYHAHFIIASKIAVSRSNQCPIYTWLTKAIKNETVDNSIRNDFYKFLVNGSGQLVGVFDANTQPMSQTVQTAITSN